MDCSLPLTFNGAHLSTCSSSSLHSSINFRSPTTLRWGMQSGQYPTVRSLVTSRSNGTAFRVLVNSNVSPGKGNYRGNVKDAIMVDPLEAKRLAAKQMQEIQAEDKLKRQRRIEAINGAWAMIGLTAGLVIEGRTGDSIPAQLEGYWRSLHFEGYWSTLQLSGYWSNIASFFDW
ncbi:hypothetical protein IFM89_010139 [Coptis chinensis]|uniref:Uncharacterized protein n=1 Tax=Coptis chinensis TaxID=261450 RepID=A0A835IBE6_9MAGN|nr:hypothetical protein IFM89_010139 [Coptis chinensis]